MDHTCDLAPIVSDVRLYLSLNGQEMNVADFALRATQNGYVGTYLDYTIHLKIDNNDSVTAFRAVLEYPTQVNCDWIRFDTDITNIVTYMGGNVISSDRLTELKAEGMKLLKSHLTPGEETAVPLDLGERELASLWYMRKSGRLLALNLAGSAKTVSIDLQKYGLIAPKSCDKAYSCDENILSIPLKRHESAIVNF